MADQARGLEGPTTTELDQQRTDCAPPTKRARTEEGDLSQKHNTSNSLNVLVKENTNFTDGRHKETDVGITERIFSGQRGNAILKQRYSDFVVQEISKTGQKIELTSLDFVHEKPKDVVESEEKFDHAELAAILSEEQLAAISSLSADSSEDSVVLHEDNDKDHRRKLHQLIKAAFQSLDTSTVTLENNGKAIKVFVRNQSAGRQSRGAPKKFCHFVLCKENKDTMDAVSLLAKFLRMKPSSFTYAGTKDKRAVTTQCVCVCNTSPQKLLGLNKRLRNMQVGNIKIEENPLKLGDLKGNFFDVLLRDFQGDPTEVANAVTSLREKGFINYYGMQRFGSGTLSTHCIGQEILKCNWKAAIDAIICQRNDGEFAKVTKQWKETSDARKTLKLIPWDRTIERTLLEGLVQLGENSYFNALQRLPRNMRLMYVHSYQSLIWNHVASKRFEMFGLNLTAGDLVFAKGANNEPTKQEPESGFILHPVLVTDDDITEARYSVYDIVLPLPGFDVVYPTNSLLDVYKDRMLQDGLDLDNMRHKVKDYSLPGAYRHVLVKPEDVNYEFIKYDDYKVSLIETNFDRLNGVEVNQGCPEGKFTALKLSFTLPSSCYATMALREIIKGDSSSAHQTELSAEFNESNKTNIESDRMNIGTNRMNIE